LGLCSSPSQRCFSARHILKVLPPRLRQRPLQRRLSALLVGSRPRNSSTRRPARRWFRRIWARSSLGASPKASSRSSLRTRHRSRSGRLKASRRRRRRRCQRITRLLIITRFRFRRCHRESRTASYLRRTPAARAPLSKPPALSDRSVRKLSAVVPRQFAELGKPRHRTRIQRFSARVVAPQRGALGMARQTALFKWDDRDSNPDALSSDRFSHHYGFRHRLRVCGPDCALTI